MKKILIVEDMEVSRYITESMPEGKYETFCAANIFRIVECIRRGVYR